MKDYKKLIEALRCNGECHDGCAYRSEDGWCDAEAKMDADAADAIEELQTKLGEQIELQTKEQGVLLDRIAELEQLIPKHGEWIMSTESRQGTVANYVFQCSECGYKEVHAYHDWKRHNFCPNCGAKMGVQDGQ